MYTGELWPGTITNYISREKNIHFGTELMNASKEETTTSAQRKTLERRSEEEENKEKRKDV